jgi:class 3 adenylate cyclase
VTLLFTDIEGSTRLLQELGRERYVEALTVHRALLREAFTECGGVEVEMQGDSFLFAFQTVGEAVAAAAAGQRALVGYRWPAEPIRVRIGLHTGEPVVADNLYAGLDVHRAARIMSAAHGGQILLSERTAGFVIDEPPDGLALRDLGEHRLKDLAQPKRLYQLLVAGLECEFLPPKTLESRKTNLPVQPTPLVGRERELDEVLALLRRDGVRLLTLTGPGGTGKTRLALQAAAELLDEFPAGVWFINLAPLTEPELVVPTVAQTLGVREQAGETLMDTIAADLAGKEGLLLLDNFEQVVEAAPALAELLASVATLQLLVTSRAPLHLSGEHEYAVPPAHGRGGACPVRGTCSGRQGKLPPGREPTARGRDLPSPRPPAARDRARSGEDQTAPRGGASRATRRMLEAPDRRPARPRPAPADATRRHRLEL